MDLKFDTEGCNAEPGTEEEFGLKGADLHAKICSLVSDIITQGNLTVSVSYPSYLSTAELNVSAPGLQQAFALGLQMLIPEFQEKLDELKE